ncbi:hypothetical protein RYX36_020379 [Vicia faba]
MRHRYKGQITIIGDIFIWLCDGNDKLSSGGKVEEVICSNRLVEEENGNADGEHEVGRCEPVVVVVMDTCMASCVVLVVVESGRQGEDEGRCAPVVVGEMGTCMASCVVLVVVESGKLGVGKCEPVVVESGKLGVDEGRCELVEVEEMSNGMDLLVVVVRNKNNGLLKFQKGNLERVWLMQE